MLFDGEEETPKPLSLLVNSLQFNNEEVKYISLIVVAVVCVNESWI